MMRILLVSAAITAALALGLAGPAAAQTPAKSDASTGDANNGKKLLGKYGCYECHGWEGQGGFAGPRIAPNPLPFPAFVRYVRAPRGAMPPYSEKLLKSERDLADIHAYLKSRPAAVPVTSLPAH